MAEGEFSHVGAVRKFFQSCASTASRTRPVSNIRTGRDIAIPAGVIDQLMLGKSRAACDTRIIEGAATFGKKIILLHMDITSDTESNHAIIKAEMRHFDEAKGLIGAFVSPQPYSIVLLDRDCFDALDKVFSLPDRPPVIRLHPAFHLREIFDETNVCTNTYGLFLTLAYLDARFSEYLSCFNSASESTEIGALDDKFLYYLPSYFGSWITRINSLLHSYGKDLAIKSAGILEIMTEDIASANATDELPKSYGKIILDGLRESVKALKAH